MVLTPEEKELIKKARNAYQKEWRRKNPDKVQATTARYWLKKAAEMKAKEERI